MVLLILCMAKIANVVGWIVDNVEKLMLLNLEFFSFDKTSVHCAKPVAGGWFNLTNICKNGCE